MSRHAGNQLPNLPLYPLHPGNTARPRSGVKSMISRGRTEGPPSPQVWRSAREPLGSEEAGLSFGCLTEARQRGLEPLAF